MAEWPKAQLGAICDFRSGVAFSPSLQGGRDGRYPFIKVSDMNLPGNEVGVRSANNWVNDKVVGDLRASPLPAGTVVFAKIGEALRQNRRRQILMPTLCDNNMMGAVPRPDVVDPLFLYYVLLTVDFMEVAQGTALPYLTVAGLSRLAVPLPPIAEQRRIVGILGALDDKIEVNRRTRETLEDTAHALFKSWFLDPKPDDSDEDGSLSDAVDLLRDLVDPQLAPDTVFQHYSLPAYDAGREAISEPGALIRSSKLVVPRGSVLVSKLNPQIERVWLPDVRPDERAICSTEFLVLRPRAHVGRAFVYEFLKSAPFRSTLTSLVTGTTGSHQRAHAEAILQVPLRLPGPSRAAQFERIVGPMLDRNAVARRESRTLVALRDALLPRLLSGEAPSYGRGP